MHRQDEPNKVQEPTLRPFNASETAQPTYYCDIGVEFLNLSLVEI